jgi:DNA-binding NarL/FixJ family response regulator
MIRVVVADDHPLVLEGLRALIEDTPDTELAGEAATGDEVVAVTLEQRPDVVVMDLRMPGADGVQATRQILREAPGTAILMLTMVDEDDSLFAALRAGARGYILKGSGPKEILRAIRVVADGEAIFSPAIAGRMTHFFAAPAAPPAFPALTPREREILALMATGVGNAVIARRLGLSEKTVRNNVSNVFTKLQVTHRAAAVAKARDAGLGDPPVS